MNVKQMLTYNSPRHVFIFCEVMLYDEIILKQSKTVTCTSFLLKCYRKSLITVQSDPYETGQIIKKYMENCS